MLERSRNTEKDGQHADGIEAEEVFASEPNEHRWAPRIQAQIEEADEYAMNHDPRVACCGVCAKATPRAPLR